MRIPRICLVLSSLLLAQIAFSQDFTPPTGELNTKDDYAKTEKTFIAAAKWLLTIPLDQQVEKRKEVSRFIFKWVTGSPTVNVELTSYVTDLVIKNPGLIMIYLGSGARYVLENNNYKDKLDKQVYALHDMI